MLRLRITTLAKFLLGTLMVQAVTGSLVVAALRAETADGWMPFALVAVLISLIVALWFAAIADNAKRAAIARTREDFVREREKIRVRAEREKHRVIKKSHEQLMRQTRRTQARASMKVSAAFAAVLGLGAVMLFTQFVTIGMLTLTTAGGALGGYLLRVRQDYRGRRKGEQGPVLPPPGRAPRALPDRPGPSAVETKGHGDPGPERTGD